MLLRTGMEEGFIEIPLSPDDPESCKRLKDVLCADREGERLVSLRRGVSIVVVVVGALLVLLYRWQHAEVGQAVRALFLVWLASLISLVRLWWLEQRNLRLIETLMARARRRQR